MHVRRSALILALTAVVGSTSFRAVADDAPARGAPADAKAIAMPHVTIDRQARSVRVECEALKIDGPLEFLCVVRNGPEHESVLRTDAKPSHIHAGLLMLGLEPGAPMRYSEAAKAWFPPHGPPLKMEIAYTDPKGVEQRIPAEQAMRDIKTKKAMPKTAWVFAGSRVRDEDKVYLADAAGYVASIVNFELSPIDVPKLVSSSNETLEWELNPELGWKTGDKVTLIISPLGDAAAAPEPAATPATADAAGDEAAQEREIAALRDQWRAAVTPHQQALRDAARTHYQVIDDLRHRQQKLIDEADRIQRLIDELEREYAELTTPQPGEPTTQPAK